MAQATWKLIETDGKSVADLSHSLSIPEPIARVLVARGYSDPERAERFFRKSLSDLPSPMGLPGICQASDRLAQAVLKKERIMVHGDFDADGITSTALITLFLRDLETNVESFLPSRLLEGHGIGVRAIEKMKESGTQLLITCDCGTNDVEQIALLESLGIDTIVTDHHQVADEDALRGIIVNPHRHPGSPDFQMLSGVGVAFTLLVALRTKLREKGFFEGKTEPNLRSYLDIVSIGTLADMVPLVDQNRLLVSSGLRELYKTTRPGFVAMKNRAGLSDLPYVRADDVGFRLAPRINAAARLGKADVALNLLLTQDPLEAERLSQELEACNQERRQIESTILRRATIEAENQVARGQAAIVVHGEDYHPGVIGLAAQRLSQRFRRPAFVFSKAGGKWKGSARSRGGVNLQKAMEACSADFEEFGGHVEAGGGVLCVDTPDLFAVHFNEAVRKQGVDATQEILIDAELNLGQLNEGFVSILNGLRPFGMGNPEPRFMATAEILGSPREVGEGHLRARLRCSSGATFSAIGFGLWNELQSRLRKRIDIIFSPEENVWQGRREIQVRLQTARPVD